MAAVKVGDGLYDVASHTDSAKTYVVHLPERICTCPHWQHRLAGTANRICRHIEDAMAACTEETATRARTIKCSTLIVLQERYECSRPEVVAGIHQELTRRAEAAARDARYREIFK